MDQATLEMVTNMKTNTMKSKFIYYGHCDKEVSRIKYYAHKRLYYNRSRKAVVTNSFTNLLRMFSMSCIYKIINMVTMMVIYVKLWRNHLICWQTQH